MSKVISTQWNLGNFTVSLTTDVEDAMIQRLAGLGLRFLGQRNTEVDKILGGFEIVNGKQKRKALWKRNEVNFTPALAEELATSFSMAELPLIGEEKEAVRLKVESAVSEYQREAAALVFKDAKAIALRHESAGDLDKWLADKCKFTGETHGADGEYAAPMLQAVHSYWKAVQAAQLAGV